MAAIVNESTFEDQNASLTYPQTLNIPAATAGNLLIATCAFPGAEIDYSAEIFTIRTNLGNFFTQVPGSLAAASTFGNNPSIPTSSAIYSAVAVGGEGFIILDRSPNVSGATSVPNIHLYELSGVDTIDVVSIANIDQNSGYTLVGGALNGTSGSSEIYIYIASCAGAIDTITPGTWTTDNFPLTFNGGAYLIGTGAQQATFTELYNQGMSVSGIALMLGSPVTGGSQPNTFVIC